MGYATTINTTLVSERSAFLTRVYGLFLASVGVACLGVEAAQSMAFTSANFLSLGWLIGIFGLQLVRKVPGVNVLALLAWTFVGGATLGPLIGLYAAHGRLDVVWQALEITMGSFLALTLYVYIAKEDFTWLGGFLVPALIGMLIVGFLDIFWPMSFGAGTLYAYLGVLLFIGFILFDTSRILTRYPDDEYVSGAIDLYLDFINMFLFVLRILSGKSRD